MTQAAERIEITLSYEEVVYLVSALAIPVLPGVPLNLYERVPEDVYTLLLAAAERALRAKGLLLYQNGRMTVESVLVGLLNFCASADHAAVFTMGTDGHRERWTAMYHLTAGLRVKHYDDLGVHHFVLLPDADAVYDDVIAQVFREAGDSASVEPFELTVRSRTFAAAQLVTLNGDQAIDQKVRDRLLEIMREEALNDTESAVLAQLAGSTFSFTASMGLWRPFEHDEGTDQTALAILKADDGWWLLRQPRRANGDDPHLHIARVPFSTVRERVSGLLAAYL